jgi:hypothetical protein
MQFEGQETGENILLLLRAHLVTLIPAVFVTVFLVILPFIVGFLLVFVGVDLSSILNPGQIFLILVFWYLIVFAYAFYRFIFWYFNVYLVTNERIIDFDFKGLLHKETSFAKLNQIQDVSPKTIGFFGTFFHYGDVFVQTAAERPEFEFHHVPKPNDVAHTIIVEVRKEEGEAPGQVL